MYTINLEFIHFLSNKSSHYGSLLIDLLFFSNKDGIKDLTNEQVFNYMQCHPGLKKEFMEYLNNKK